MFSSIILMETFGMVVNVLWDFIAACEAEDVVASIFVIKEQSNWRAHVMWHVLFHGYMVTKEKQESIEKAEEFEIELKQIEISR